MSIFAILSRIRRHPLNRGRSTQAILRFMRWQVASRLAPGEVLYHWIDECRVSVGRGDQGFTGNIYCGLVELPEMAYVLHVARSDDLFVDVGANVGAYTLLACAVAGARGLCFEPIPSTFEQLHRNLRINDLVGRVEACNVGVADRPGAMAVTASHNCENHVLAPGETDPHAIQVPVTTLDAALAGRAATMLKIDVEGFETAVIGGADVTLREPALHTVIMELNGSGARYGYDEAALIQRMAGYGLHAHRYDAFERCLRPASRSDWTGNLVFVRDAGAMSARARAAGRRLINGVEL